MLKLVRDHYPLPGGARGDNEAGQGSHASRKRALDGQACPAPASAGQGLPRAGQGMHSLCMCLWLLPYADAPRGQATSSHTGCLTALAGGTVRWGGRIRARRVALTGRLGCTGTRQAQAQGQGSSCSSRQPVGHGAGL